MKNFKKELEEIINLEFTEHLVKAMNRLDLKQHLKNQILSLIEKRLPKERKVHYILNARQGDYRCVFCGETNINKNCLENPYNQALSDIKKELGIE